MCIYFTITKEGGEVPIPLNAECQFDQLLAFHLDVFGLKDYILAFKIENSNTPPDKVPRNRDTFE